MHIVIICHYLTNYTSAHGSGRRYYILFLKFLSFFSFATGSPRWLYQQGTFLAQMVGYRCNFKNWVENLGGDNPLKFGGPKPPNVENQSRSTRSKLIVEWALRTSIQNWFQNFGGSPQKNLKGVKFQKVRY